MEKIAFSVWYQVDSKQEEEEEEEHWSASSPKNPADLILTDSPYD